MKTIKNECGTFHVDENGCMRGYICDPKNIYKVTNTIPLDVKKLILPEGITELPEHAFQFYKIQTELRLPGTLRTLQDLALDVMEAPDVVFPGNLEYIGFGVLARARIRSVRLPQQLNAEYRNMLRHSDVGTVYLPEAYLGKLDPSLLKNLQVEKEQEGYCAICQPEGYLPGKTVRNIISQCIDWEKTTRTLLTAVLEKLSIQVEESVPETGRCREVGVSFQYVDHSCIGVLRMYGFGETERSVVAGACQRGNDRLVSNLLFRGTKQECLAFLRSPETLGELIKDYEHLQEAAEMAD